MVMRQLEAQAIVHALAARSLRNLASKERRKQWASFPEFPINMTQTDESLVAREMLALASRLEASPVEKPFVEGATDDASAADGPVGG